jgi:hypothetical protein
MGCGNGFGGDFRRGDDNSEIGCWSHGLLYQCSSTPKSMAAAEKLAPPTKLRTNIS